MTLDEREVSRLVQKKWKELENARKKIMRYVVYSRGTLTFTEMMSMPWGYTQHLYPELNRLAEEDNTNTSIG